MLWQKSACELSTLLEKREVSSREVVQAHLQRIGEVDKRLNAFTHVLSDAALAEADARDRSGRAGPLHGLPITLKENIEVAGSAATFGSVARNTSIAKDDAPIVKLLREAGAVILGRTNVAQLGLFAESRNPLFGQTANPWSLAHTPGGSSGGEGAAIAAGMSCLGLGTDIGGSIRVPAHFCGIAGLKPTLDRLPMRGVGSGIAGQEAGDGVARPAPEAGNYQLVAQPEDASVREAVVVTLTPGGEIKQEPADPHKKPPPA